MADTSISILLYPTRAPKTILYLPAQIKADTLLHDVGYAVHPLWQGGKPRVAHANPSSTCIT